MKMAESSPNGQITLTKGEIALYTQFPLFLQCFQKTYSSDTLGLVWETVNFLLRCINTYRCNVTYMYVVNSNSNHEKKSVFFFIVFLQLPPSPFTNLFSTLFTKKREYFETNTLIFFFSNACNTDESKIQ